MPQSLRPDGAQRMNFALVRLEPLGLGGCYLGGCERQRD